MQPAPIAIFAFTRGDTLSRVLDNLSRCERLTCEGTRACYAFVDGPRSDKDREAISHVVTLLKEFKSRYFQTMVIVCREKNLGNPVNMPMGISEVLDVYGRVIVIEDDILVSRTFLTYMDEALEKYAHDDRIWCVNGWRNRYVKVPHDYGADVYLNLRNMCWGWGTWRNRWDSVDMAMSDWAQYKKDDENFAKVVRAGGELPAMLDRQAAGLLRAWDVQCTYHMIKHSLYAVEPIHALTKNIGFGTECDHCSEGNSAISTSKYYSFRPRLPLQLNIDERIAKQFRYANNDSRLLHRILRKLQRIWWSVGPRHDAELSWCIKK